MWWCLGILLVLILRRGGSEILMFIENIMNIFVSFNFVYLCKNFCQLDSWSRIPRLKEIDRCYQTKVLPRRMCKPLDKYPTSRVLAPWLILGLVYLFVCFVFWDLVSLCSPGQPLTQDPPTSSFWVLKSQAYTTTLLLFINLPRLFLAEALPRGRLCGAKASFGF